MPKTRAHRQGKSEGFTRSSFSAGKNVQSRERIGQDCFLDFEGTLETLRLEFLNELFRKRHRIEALGFVCPS